MQKSIIYDDKMLQPNMFCAKNLITNDKIIFQNNNQGIADLLRFLEEWFRYRCQWIRRIYWRIN
ncbi:hypothetical protein NWQ33_00705 [Mycoplasmopsis cynos]|nr:hypothetical protein [Mycoplasmopsis cynos]